jgi:hypothetical protein
MTMTHYKSLLDPGVFLGPQDFPAERTVKISRVVKEALPDREEGKSATAPMMYLVGKDGTEYPRKLKVPKSVLYGLSLALGTELEAWVGKEITVYSAKCLAFGEVEDCLRVRFPADVEARIYKWLKKRKASKSAYLYTKESA